MIKRLKQLWEQCNWENEKNSVSYTVNKNVGLYLPMKKPSWIG